MSVSKKFTIVFITFFLIVLLYLFLFIFVPSIQMAIVQTRHIFSSLTQGSNYIWALLISFFICFLGTASIGFPIPFPIVLFSLSNSIIGRFLDMGFQINQILQFSTFWLEILSLTIAGGLGSALGEFTGYIIGYSAKNISKKKNSDIINNMDGFGKLILENKKRTPLYIFIFALTPLPDDILFLPLGMIKYPFWKCFIPGWLGKNFTTFFYCCLPIFVALGITSSGVNMGDNLSIIIEAILLLGTIVVMFLIMTFDWTKFIEKRNPKKEK